MTPSEIGKLAKAGRHAELRELWCRGEHFSLAAAFHKAVQDFRTVKRNPGHLKTLEFCIDRGLEPNSQLACTAALHGNRAIIDYMIEKGLSQDPFLAAVSGNVRFLEQMGQKHSLADLHDDSGFNLLHWCAGSGLGRDDETTAGKLAEVCALLIEQEVSTTHRVEDGITITPAFRCAASGGNARIMEQLLDAGEIDVTGMHLEVEFTLEPHQRSGPPFYEVAQLIVDRGFDVNSMRANQGRTLLHGSANRGTKLAVAWLLKMGADPNALDVDGRTPLHVAAERNTHTAAIELLVHAGADIVAKDPSGITARNIAESNGRKAVVDMLSTLAENQ